MIRILSKGYLPISLLPPSKLSTMLQKVKEALQINNRDNNLVIKSYISIMILHWSSIPNVTKEI